jgi:hypothetical protein
MAWWLGLYSMVTAMFSMLLDVAQFWRDVSEIWTSGQKWAA